MYTSQANRYRDECSAQLALHDTDIRDLRSAIVELGEAPRTPNDVRVEEASQLTAGLCGTPDVAGMYCYSERRGTVFFSVSGTGFFDRLMAFEGAVSEYREQSDNKIHKAITPYMVFAIFFFIEILPALLKFIMVFERWGADRGTSPKDPST